MLRRTDPADLLVTGALEDSPTVPTWSTGRMVLIGDAAHPTLSSSRQAGRLARRRKCRAGGSLPTAPQSLLTVTSPSDTMVEHGSPNF
ncbi:MAG: hypothetical protein M3291_05815 [Actinomycetota bacterium]|nr:hypothetical protein [Actinomycetota bacterium]MDQ4038319.1 hypothetical protein [Actinomycetota bacterium]